LHLFCALPVVPLAPDVAYAAGNVQAGEGEENGMRRVALVLTVAAIMALALAMAGAALAGGKDGGGGGGDHDGKKRLCVKHFTSSETNPYNFLYLPRKAALNHVANHGDRIIRGVDSRAECKALDDTP
jgi:hypothetical protein